MDGHAESVASLCNHVRSILAASPAPPVYRVAFSGGRDSMVLLHAMHRLALPARLEAIHVHHGLHAEADRWAAFCMEQCRALGVPLAVARIDARPPAGESPEAWAREMRYQTLRIALGTGEVLLTAHHEQDQAETLLLQLLRGAGPAGLAAMPVRSIFGRGSHLRPLLDVPATAIARYATDADLAWMDDHSNADTRYDRNYLRQKVLPLLTDRWPRAAHSVARAARWQADATSLLAEIASADLEAARGSRDGLLNVSALAALQPPRQRNALRAWLAGRGLTIPSAVQLEQVSTMLAGRRDALARARWRGAEVRRYRDDLHAMRPLPAHDADASLAWGALDMPLELPVGRLRAVPDEGSGVSRRAIERKLVTVRFRDGGERCRLADGAPSRRLKILLQEWNIPPWLRDRVPLVCADEELVAVADIAVAAEFQAQPGEEGMRLCWEGETAAAVHAAITRERK